MDQTEIERLAGGPARLSLDDIIHHPRIAEARKVYLDRLIGLYSGDPHTVRLLIESGRFLVYHIAGVIDAGSDPDRRETWLTVKRLKQEMRLFGVASERHIDGLIARLCSTGFLQMRPAEQDRRVRILKPTEKLKAHDREWLAAHFAPLIVLFPEHDYSALMGPDSEFHAAFRRSTIAFVPYAASMLLAMPDVMLYFNHAAGAVVQAELLRLTMEAPGFPDATIPYAGVGDRFGVSRTHVRQMLIEAEAAGLVKLINRDRNRVQILPRQWASYDRGIGVGMYLNDLVYMATIRAMQRERSSELAVVA